jgi:hypothetical protein
MGAATINDLCVFCRSFACLAPSRFFLSRIVLFCSGGPFWRVAPKPLRDKGEGLCVDLLHVIPSF